MTAPERELGWTGARIPALGLGCMGMSMWLGIRDDHESARTLHEALDLGVTLLDTADSYGPYRNEELIGDTLHARRDEIFLCTKFGLIFDDDARRIGLDGSPAHVRRSIEGSLRRLRTDHVDLYFLHRVDPNIAIEETVGAMSELVSEGKVRFLGLSEPGAGSLRRAHATHPIAAIENEYSLWTRTAETQTLPIARELGMSMLAYSPLGRGFFGGRIRSTADLAETDVRRDRFPRFSEENLAQNMEWLKRVEALAERKGCSLPQLALAWVIGKGADIVAIPGTKRRAYLRENVRALDIALTPADIDELEQIVDAQLVAGAQKDNHGMSAMGN